MPNQNQYLDDVATDAWRVWSHMNTRAKGSEPLDGVPGKIFKGTVAGVTKVMCPQIKDDEREARSRDIRNILRQTGNALCLDDGIKSGHTTWWVRSVWNSVQTPVTLHRTPLTRAEQKLTRKEAGEDRPAPPVSVRRVLDERWRQEIFSLRVKDENGSFLRVVKVVADGRPNRKWDQVQLSTLAKAKYANVYFPVTTMEDMGLLTRVETIDDSSEWSICASQHELLLDALTTSLENFTDDREHLYLRVARFMQTRMWVTVGEVARDAFAIRQRVVGCLQRLEKENCIEKRQAGRGFEWRATEFLPSDATIKAWIADPHLSLKEKVAAPHPVPKPTQMPPRRAFSADPKPSPAPSPSTPVVPEPLDNVSRLVSDLVQAEVQRRVSEAAADVGRLNAENEELRRKNQELSLQLEELRHKIRKGLDQLLED